MKVITEKTQRKQVTRSTKNCNNPSTYQCLVRDWFATWNKVTRE